MEIFYVLAKLVDMNHNGSTVDLFAKTIAQKISIMMYPPSLLKVHEALPPPPPT